MPLNNNALTITVVLADAKRQLATAGVETAFLDGQLLLAHVMGVEREVLIRDPQQMITKEQWVAFDALLQRRVQRQPISQLLGKREFWSHEFIVTHDTLTPRPDSETLIEAVLEIYPDRSQPLRILDLGTGTGCLLLTLLAQFSKATGLGVDMSEAAIGVASDNAQKLGLANRVGFIVDSWAKGVDAAFDVIISNPPYIKNSDIATLDPEVSRYEPRIALFAGDDGLDCYRAIAPRMSDLLGEGGKAFVELGQGQKQQVEAILQDSDLFRVCCKKDLAGIERCIVVEH